MNFLADENIANSVIEFLKENGHQVFDVKKSRLRGAGDRALLEHAKNHGFIVLTHDKDFINLYQRSLIKVPTVVINLGTVNPERVRAALLALLIQGIEIQNKLVILRPQLVRIFS